MFNTQVFNGISSMVVASATPFSITYNGQYLNDGVTYFGSVKYLNNKAIKYDSDFTDLNDGVIYNVREGEKGIQISGMIKSTDRGSLLAIIDTFKSSLLESNKMLVITEGSQSRQAKCVCSDLQFSEDTFNIAWMNFTATFITYEYMQDVSAQTLNATTSLASLVVPIDRAGTAEAKSYFILSFSAASGVTSVSVDINGTILTVLGTFASSDILVIDGQGLTVKKNGVSQSFTGTFPKFKLTNNTVTVTTNGASRTYDLTVQYNPAYK